MWRQWVTQKSVFFVQSLTKFAEICWIPWHFPTDTATNKNVLLISPLLLYYAILRKILAHMMKQMRVVSGKSAANIGSLLSAFASQRLTEITGDYRRLPEINGDYRRLPEIARDCRRLLEIAGYCWRLLEIAWDCGRLLEIARDCQRLPEIAGERGTHLTTKRLFIDLVIYTHIRIPSQGFGRPEEPVVTHNPNYAEMPYTWTRCSGVHNHSYQLHDLLKTHYKHANIARPLNISRPCGLHRITKVLLSVICDIYCYTDVIQSKETTQSDIGMCIYVTNAFICLFSKNSKYFEPTHSWNLIHQFGVSCQQASIYGCKLFWRDFEDFEKKRRLWICARSLWGSRWTS